MRQRGLVAVLEDIHDPHNAAAILRTAEAFGISDIALIFEKEKYWNPRRVGSSSSASANKWLRFSIYRSTQACLGDLRKKGFEIVATGLTQDSKSLLQSKLTGRKVAVFFGNEHRGLSPLALRSADHVVRIPMRGMVQSLNVSVSAAIVLWEIVRQRSSNPRKHRLSGRDRRAFMHDMIRAAS
ncbi:MAG: hypothetical protein A2722_01070 [Candidatus Doudnabacteria bacterium RIFCSPHIGHO2_01_FULL_50_11]|uniref:tRNA/rRNA methyltransferase SpoU type domain-containing protein n=1 Tax=Candidatus Doudnabacteria bacterium RIFCSPHIGHO2_01_FULL_50_11 TaxID=1817828 RepID=A0A1F5PEW5_9BACT|nr:MAG: hypothetical protein A2722_01070 [Candidatus Doudnabacteria bacterium RIFCSPHIGHO2_01_FULL_50_11]